MYSTNQWLEVIFKVKLKWKMSDNIFVCGCSVWINKGKAHCYTVCGMKLELWQTQDMRMWRPFTIKSAVWEQFSTQFKQNRQHFSWMCVKRAHSVEDEQMGWRFICGVTRQKPNQSTNRVWTLKWTLDHPSVRSQQPKRGKTLSDG